MIAGAPVISSVRLASPQLERLAGCDIRFVHFAHASRRELSDALHDAQGLLIDSHVTADSALLELAPDLRALSTISVGTDHIDLAAASRRDITVTHTPVLSDAVADLTLALILMTARRLGEAVHILRQELRERLDRDLPSNESPPPLFDRQDRPY